MPLAEFPPGLGHPPDLDEAQPRVKRQHRLPILVVAVALLFVPLFTGVAVNGIARWLPIGLVLLHAGLLVLPAISVLAAEGKGPGKIALIAALVAVFLQPDAGTGLAITGAAIGLYVARPHWATGCIAFAAFLASLSMLVRGELPAQPYVERILVDAAQVSLWLAVGILVALLGTVALLAVPGLPAVAVPVGRDRARYLDEDQLAALDVDQIVFDSSNFGKQYFASSKTLHVYTGSQPSNTPY